MHKSFDKNSKNLKPTKKKAGLNNITKRPSSKEADDDQNVNLAASINSTSIK